MRKIIVEVLLPDDDHRFSLESFPKKEDGTPILVFNASYRNAYRRDTVNSMMGCILGDFINDEYAYTLLYNELNHKK